MKIKLNSEVEYWVSWEHGNFVNESHQYDKQLLSYTKCIIENKTNPSIKEGISKLGKNEKFFNKDKGRKISLKRAMLAIGLNKETRTLFWNEYHKLTNKKLNIK